LERKPVSQKKKKKQLAIQSAFQEVESLQVQTFCWQSGWFTSLLSGFDF